MTGSGRRWVWLPRAVTALTHRSTRERLAASAASAARAPAAATGATALRRARSKNASALERESTHQPIDAQACALRTLDLVGCVEDELLEFMLTPLADILIHRHGWTPSMACAVGGHPDATASQNPVQCLPPDRTRERHVLGARRPEAALVSVFFSCSGSRRNPRQRNEKSSAVRRSALSSP
jgi:hypothetical protein